MPDKGVFLEGLGVNGGSPKRQRRKHERITRPLYQFK